MGGKCFVICPIGEVGSSERLRSDKLLKHIVAPVVEPRFKVLRADKLAKPGVITDQIIQHLLGDELVISDLTGSNPNVYYELALRHVTRKAFVQLIEQGEKIPFDNFNMRTIQYGFDIEAVDRCKAELQDQIADATVNSGNLTSPVSTSQDLTVLTTSHNALERTNAQILKALSEIRSEVSHMADKQRKPKIEPRALEELMMILTELTTRLAVSRGRGRGYDEETRMWVHRARRAMEFVALESGLPPDFVQPYGRRLRDLDTRAGE